MFLEKQYLQISQGVFKMPGSKLNFLSACNEMDQPAPGFEASPGNAYQG
ncbi:MAG: hypothetical protein JRI54_09620 [Deltaproteobacteria bacterium]|nr:hypothetical protein [Deltaproteobacteria bacterium]